MGKSQYAQWALQLGKQAGQAQRERGARTLLRVYWGKSTAGVARA
ncbi:hypothetical protein [Demequina globuliformis]|nr:hypothetical protein [Demequina globuliformis]